MERTKTSRRKICCLRLLYSNSCTNSCKCLSVIQVSALTDDALIQATFQWINEWMDGWLDEWMNGRVNEWMNEWNKQTNIEPRKQSQMVVRTTMALESIDSNHVFVFMLFTSIPSSIVAHSWLYIIRWLMASNWAVAIEWAHARERTSARAPLCFFRQWNKII